MTVSLCYFVMVHKDPEQFARLLSRIRDPRDRIIAHVSLTTPTATRNALESVALSHHGVDLLPPTRIRWGHWSLAECHRRAIAMAMSLPDWDYMINLSGSCYPIKPVEQIRSTLGAARPGADADPLLWPNYIDMKPIDECPPLVRRWIERYWVRVDERDRGVPLWRRRPPAGVDCRWKGSNWTVLHRNFCRWLDRDPVAESIRRFLRHAKHPTEFWQQWSLMSSPFRETRCPGMHYVRWAGEAHPLALTSADLGALSLARAFFARKFESSIDSEVLDQVDAMLAHPPRWRREELQT
jgi:Core-2/I-Branching enzyme